MRIILVCFSVFFLCNLWAQDTTWVQTYTFDSITTRRAVFTFPAALNSKRFEKVLMYHKLKCSPLTTSDEYDCGEWDASTWTRIIQHTGIYDSIEVQGSRYLVNTQQPAVFPYTLNETHHQQWKSIQHRSPLVTTGHMLIDTDGSTLTMASTNAKGKTFQWLITDEMLTQAGVVTGDLQALTLFFNEANAALQNVKISLKQVTINQLNNFQNAGFTTVYNNHLSVDSIGAYTFHFHAPFTWDGVSNLVIELSYADANVLASDITLEASQNNSGLHYPHFNGQYTSTSTNHAELNFNNVDLGGDFTISFWAKGNGSAGTNTTLFEAVDSVGNRILNLHFPWSDNNIYFDAGSGGTYDRISKQATVGEIDGAWNHWACVKNAATGQMLIYKNGTLWHSGNGLTNPVGKIAKMYFGASVADNISYRYKGEIDEFSIWNSALNQTVISSWMNKKITAAHPNFGSLQAYYDFDDTLALIDHSAFNRLGMNTTPDLIHPEAYPVAGVSTINLFPKMEIVQGTYSNAVTDSVLTTMFTHPDVVFEHGVSDNNFTIENSFLAYSNTQVDTLSTSGNLLSFSTNLLPDTLINESISYFNPPFELEEQIEIGRYITPYGIGFSLGPNGSTWIYDVTDYHQFLKGNVDLIAGNDQELIDLRFAFIEGIPPRDVHSRVPVWSNFNEHRHQHKYLYNELDSDAKLAAVQHVLSDTSSMFKIKSRLTGHGHEGSVNCCEWAPKMHQILIDDVPRFNWSIWVGDRCGENPHIGQGGTWPYAREGWCPGDMVKEYDHELTPYVQPGDTIEIDYDIEDIPANDQDQGNGDYIMAFDLFSYSSPNFQHDAAIVDVLNPNSWEYYGKYNPTCANPRVILQNTGSEPLTHCKLRCWVTYGNWQEIEWTGNLGFLEKEIVEIPITDQNWWFGANPDELFHAQVYNVQGEPDLDEYPQNNLFKTKYVAPETINEPFFVYFKTNNKANENKWRLTDAAGTILFERTTLANNTEYRDTFNLAPGCYSITLEDSDHDGIGFWWSAQTEGETAGQFRLRKVNAGVIESFPSDFGKYHRYDFSVGFTVASEELKTDELVHVYPNPTADNLEIEYSGILKDEIKRITIVDIEGKVLKSIASTPTENILHTIIDVRDLSNGIYLIVTELSDGETLKNKFIKEQ